MLVYRIEHHETGFGPFQSEFYPKDADYDNIHPFKWGGYIPVSDDVHDYHYQYDNRMRRFGCHDQTDIQRMTAEEGERLAEWGWVVRVYEVPLNACFVADSGKQCVFDLAVAILQFTYDLIQFILGKEVDYVQVPG